MISVVLFIGVCSASGGAEEQGLERRVKVRPDENGQGNQGTDEQEAEDDDDRERSPLLADL
ncbi:hypothetical protein [Halomonas litopenaei]|uniref:hypothetical protein n=1 Tax=Halomonas litopenaei TaxID=2109328 RepID=UPI001A8BF69D|nr:hypothetical protein [Halomonas litopenaei]MBN8414018.1 hypothetical protein [Halomonas litopenaei]